METAVELPQPAGLGRFSSKSEVQSILRATSPSWTAILALGQRLAPGEPSVLGDGIEGPKSTFELPRAK